MLLISEDATQRKITWKNRTRLFLQSYAGALKLLGYLVRAMGTVAKKYGTIQGQGAYVQAVKRCISLSSVHCLYVH